MKKLLVAMLALAMILMVSSISFGYSTTHSLEGEWFSVDQWYGIGPTDPYAQVGYFSVSDVDVSQFLAEYYQNDQTFALVNGSDNGSNNATVFMGSYLFKVGFFIELGSFNSDSDDFTFLSPGYRFNLDDNSYASFQVDYAMTDIEDDIVGYELRLKYYQDTYKFTGQVYIPDEGDTYFNLGFAAKASDDVIIGLNYADEGDLSAYSIGLTWDAPVVILDARYGVDEDEESLIEVSGMFKASDNLRVGLYVEQPESIDDLGYALQLRYLNDKANFQFQYFLENAPYLEMYRLLYYTNF